MADNFDPYQNWLGIEPHERPLDHYRLLGIERFETRREVIQTAADQRMGYIRSFQSGPRVAHTQRLLNELATAKLCLLDAGAKAGYDTALRARLFPAPAPPAPVAYAHPVAYAQPVPPPGGATGYGAGGYVPHASAPPPPPPLPQATYPYQPEASAREASPATPYQPDAPARQNSPAAPSSEPAPADNSPIYTRAWFPAAVGGGLLLVAGLIWGANKYIAQQREVAKATPIAEQPETPDEEPPPEPEPSPVVQTVIEPAGDGSVTLPATAAQLHGSVELGSQVVTNWKSTDDWLSWEFQIKKPGRYIAEISYAAAPESEGGRYELAIGDDRHRVDIRTGAKPEEFVTDKKPLFIRKSGRHTLSLRAADLHGKELFTFKSITLSPHAAGK